MHLVNYLFKTLNSILTCILKLEKPNILNFKVKNHLFDILTNVTILKHTSFRTLTEISNLGKSI